MLFLCPRSGVLAEIVIFFSLSFLSITNDSLADPGEGPGPPLFSDQTDAWRVERNFFETGGLDDHPLPYLKVWICHCDWSPTMYVPWWKSLFINNELTWNYVFYKWWICMHNETIIIIYINNQFAVGDWCIFMVYK